MMHLVGNAVQILLLCAAAVTVLFLVAFAKVWWDYLWEVAPLYWKAYKRGRQG